MKKVLITGVKGFIGKNLFETLLRRTDVEITGYDLNDDASKFPQLLKEADIIFHLAGVNRPSDVVEFESGNFNFTQEMVALLKKGGKKPVIVMASSTQAALDNPYGRSKNQAEQVLFKYGLECGAKTFIYRLTNVFGKWCKPNYNSVVATFCHNICRNMAITIADPNKNLELVYIDDVVAEFEGILDGKESPVSGTFLAVQPTYTVSLGDLAEKLYRIRAIRETLVIPDLADDFMRKLHATYLSYLDENNFSYHLDSKIDNRGLLAELIKSPNFGQMFVSKTFSGITRGNHYHNSKIEKFCVLQGTAVIKFRNIFSNEVLSYHVSGDKLEVVDIPPGYTHSIENLSDGEMIVLFWANQIFDPKKPDTYYLEVKSE